MIVVLVARSIGLFVLAAVFEIGGAWLVWRGLREHRGMVFDGYRPDRFDILGAAICLVGMSVIMYAPRPG